MKGSFLVIACCVLAAKSLASDVICERTYDRLGCYEEKNPGVALLNERANVNWDNIAGFMHSLACQCAALARTGGYAGFALHYIGECYGRTSENLTALTSKSSVANLCIGDQTYSSCDSEHAECTGRQWAEAIYRFKSSAKENVDGGLSEWQAWTTCDKECGSGFQHRERNCNNPEPKGEGNDCGDLGELSEAKACEIKKCAVNGNWGAWGSYGSCSKDCGSGTQSRSRSCNNPSPANGGAACFDSAMSARYCNTDPCPINGNWGAWGSYGSCSKDCGTGTQSRSHSCNNPSPANGGAACSGSATSSQSCNTDACPPINGNWGAWGSYGSCSTGCRTGSQSRSRSCNNPSPANGGAACSGSVTSSQSCNSDTWACPSLSFCTTKYTAYQTHSSGKMTYLDRHTMSCGGANTVMTMFHLQRSSDNMRYQYKCCTFQANVCNLQIKYTSFSDNGNGNTIYLDRHTADCSATGFINYLKVENDSGNENVRYKYYCANLVAKWQPKASCYSATTSYSDDGDGKVYFLDRQTVSCDSGYALSYVKLQRKSSTKQWRYLYRCCKVTY